MKLSLQKPVLNIIQRIITRYHDLHDRILFERDVPYVGTSAIKPEDFRNYITHAAFYKLKGFGPPSALGRSGNPPWFASKKGVEEISKRYAGSTDENFGNEDYFDYILPKIPKEIYTEPEYITEAGVIGTRRSGIRKLSFFNAEIKSDKTRKKEYVQEKNPGLLKSDQDLLYSGVKLGEKVVGIIVFMKHSDTDLYKIVNAAMKRSGRGSGLSKPEARLIKMAFRKHQHSIMMHQNLSMDFMGPVEPKAAKMGYSIFKILRKIEIDRLRSLGKPEFDALYKRTVSYEYPVLKREQLVTAVDFLKRGIEGILRRIGLTLKTA